MLSSPCGDCNACCKRHEIPNVFWSSEPKPMDTLCEKWCDGCTIYEERPKDCSDFECLWLMMNKARGGNISTSLRPKEVGGMAVSHLAEDGTGQILIEEIEPGSFDLMNMTTAQQQLITELVVLANRQDIPSAIYFRSYDWKTKKINFEVEEPDQCQSM